MARLRLSETLRFLRLYIDSQVIEIYAMAPALRLVYSVLLVSAGLVRSQYSMDYDSWSYETANLTVDYQTLTTPVTVCACYYTGLSQTNRNTSASAWNGYEMDLIRAAFEIVASEGDAQMEFNNINWQTGVCNYWQLLFLQLGTNGSYGTRPCDMVFGGTDQTSDRMKNGVIFSAGLMSGGNKILVFVPTESKLWVFLKPFTVSLWLLMFSTCVIAAMVIWLFEVKNEHFRSRPKFVLSKLQGYMFSTTGMMLQGIKDITVKTHPSRLFTLGYCFLVLVLMNTYIAALSSQLTSSALKLQINTVNDIVSLKVGIYSGDTETLARYRLQDPVSLQWNNQDDEKAIIQKLRSRQVDALLMDGAFSDYYSTITCDIYEVGTVVRPFDFALSMAVDTPRSRVDAINNALTTLKTQGLYDDLYAKYFGSGLQSRSTCPSDKSYTTLTTTQLKLTDMAGLWVFFGAALGLGILVNLALWLAKKSVLAMRAGGGSSSSTDHGMTKGSTKFKFFPSDEDEITVADAGSVEEMLQVMEKKFKGVEKKIHEYGANINAALEDLNDKFKSQAIYTTQCQARASEISILSTDPPISPHPPMAPPPTIRSPSKLGFQRDSSAQRSAPSWAERAVDSPSRNRSPLSFNKVLPVVDFEEGGRPSLDTRGEAGPIADKATIAFSNPIPDPREGPSA